MEASLGFGLVRGERAADARSIRQLGKLLGEGRRAGARFFDPAELYQRHDRDVRAFLLEVTAWETLVTLPHQRERASGRALEQLLGLGDLLHLDQVIGLLHSRRLLGRSSLARRGGGRLLVRYGRY